MPLIRFSIPERDAQIVINPKRDALTLTVNRLTIVTFDRTGRWIGAFLDGKNYKRGADNRAMEKWAEVDGGLKIRRRRDLSGAEQGTLVERLYQLARSTLHAMQVRQVTARNEEADDLAAWAAAKTWLERITTWTPDRLEEDRTRFLQVYKPITILPPDQYRAVVLQITEGCTYNRCTFCDFYRDRPFRMKPLDEVREHIAAVQAFFGESLGLRHVIFLADANALVAPRAYLEGALEQIAASFTIAPSDLPVEQIAGWRKAHPTWFRGVYSFIDVFTGHHKSIEEFRALQERGLQRVYIGLETGNAELLGFLNKPGSPAEARELVQMIRAAGVHVGIIVMAGVGGDRFAQSHVEKTAALVSSLGLGRNDLVYISEFVEHPESDYTQRIHQEGIRPLSRREVRAQMDALRSGFHFDQASRPKVAVYDIHEFIY